MAQKEIPRVNKDHKRLKPVAKGSIEKPKKSGADILENQIANHIKIAIEYAIKDEIVPKAKEAIRGAVGNFTDSILYGHGKAPTRNGSSYTDYSGVSRGRRLSQKTTVEKPRATYKTISFKSEDAARDVLEALCELINDQGYASVGDFFDASEVSSEYTDFDWGWENLDDARIRGPIDGKYTILFPSSPKRIR